jgi:multiple sugar transport system substrate-binding protein
MKKNLRLAAGLGLSLALAASAVACGGGSAQQEQKVTSLSIVSGNNPWAAGIKKLLPEYEKQTGIKVNIETFGNEQLNDQYKVKLNASSADTDVMVYQPQDVMREFTRNKWLTDLSDYTSKDASWKWSDFQKPAQEAAALDGKIYGVPLMTERHVMYYRADILKANNIEVPKTLDELKAATVKLNDPAKGFYGITMRGQKVPSVTQFSSFLYSFGGDFAKDGKATLDSPEAVKAYTFYGDLLKTAGPPGATNMGFVEASAIFAQGNAAFYLDADSQAYNFLDKTNSNVIDTVAYGSFPAGPAGSKPYNTVPWVAGVSEFSKKKDAAFEFIKWATSEEMFKTLMVSDTVPSPRQSTWDDATASAKFPAGLVKIVQGIAETGVGRDRPQLEQVARAREFVGGPVVTAIEGGDVAGAATAANKSFQELLDKESK